MADRKPMVLMVEDNAADAVLAQTALGAVGFDCSLVCVENAVQAYAFLLGRQPFNKPTVPDLIILDLNLPIIKGSEFLRELRGSTQWRNLPVIVFSSSRREEDIREALSLGALQFVTKPPVWSQYVQAAREIHRQWLMLSGAA